VPHNHPNRTPEAVVEKVLHLRCEYHLGPIRIVWYPERYHGVKIVDAGVAWDRPNSWLNYRLRGSPNFVRHLAFV
jgi:hypothetical protein